MVSWCQVGLWTFLVKNKDSSNKYNHFIDVTSKDILSVYKKESLFQEKIIFLPLCIFAIFKHFYQF